MYSLLIVDDEPEVVGWLYSLFLEATYLELEVYKAYSAKEALMLLDTAKIDIVLSDIRMPGLNGLQLMERIRQTWPKCRMIFLTGYKDFEYVYTAIQNEGIRYLLKTEGDDKILSTVQEAIHQIEDSLRNEEMVKKARQQMIRMLPLMQREFLNGLISGSELDIERLQERFDELGIPLSVDIPVRIFIGRFDDHLSDENSSQKYECCLTLKQIVDDYLSDQLNSVQIINENFEMIWIVQPIMQNLKGNNAWDEFHDKAFARTRGVLEFLQGSCRKTLGKTISFAVSEEELWLNTIAEKYGFLKKLLGYRIGLATEMILNKDSFMGQNIREHSDEYKIIHDAYKQLGKVSLLEKYLESQRKKEYFTLLASLIESLRGIKSRNCIYALEIYYNVSMALLSYINYNNIAEKVAFKTGLYKLSRADEHTSWDEAVDYLNNVSIIIFDIMAVEEEGRAEDIVNKIMQYIDSHLKEDLALVRLADIFHFNPSYLSRLFKQVAGINLSDYILNARVEKAKEFLANSYLKVNEISIEVGYESPHSFARFFRNATGMSPQEYRTALINM